MFRSCFHSTIKHTGRLLKLSRSISSVHSPVLSYSLPVCSYFSISGNIYCNQSKWSNQIRYFSSHPNTLAEYEKNENEELDAEEGAEEGIEFDENEEFEKEFLEEENGNMKKDDSEEGGSNGNPLEYYIREELYPGLSEDVIEKLHYPERGLSEDALVDDLPLFPNPFDHSQDEDNETDPEKIRKEDYNFNGANVMIETRDYVFPHTWEDEKLGPPHENRIVRLRVRVRELGLPIVAAQKLVLMAGPRYNFNNDVLTLTTDRFFTRKQNGRYLMDLLEKLVEEAKKGTEIQETPKRMRVKRGRYLPFNKDMLGTGAVKKQYEGMITEDE